jgi:spermidine synthase
MKDRRIIALLLAFLIGFLALSLEMIWIRIVEFTRHAAADSFGFVLFAFLSGIAVGAFFAGRLVLKKDIDVFSAIPRMLIAAALLSYVSIPLVAEAVTSSLAFGFGLSLFLIALMAGAYGMIFPLLCHVAVTPDEPAGRTISLVYMANILGATLSPLLTGLYLFDHFSLSAIVAAIAAVSALAALLLHFMSSCSIPSKFALASVLLVATALVIQVHDGFYRDIYAKLLFKDHWPEKQSFRYVLENRGGVITVEEKKYGGDAIYGGGVWDGRFQVNLGFDVNDISRAFLIAALHPDPREVLEIGLASGSFALVLDAYEPIQALDIIEINRGYPEIIRHYPEHSRLFESAKVKLHIDDGRRWLKRNPGRKFDLIVMDVSWHERNNITNLLSIDFLHILKSHLRPGGVLYYNTTDSDDVIYTAAQVFRHVVRYKDFIAVGDAPFDMRRLEAEANLQSFIEQPVAARYKMRIPQPALARLANEPLVDIADGYRRRSDLVVITDDNMATEFRRPDLTAGVPWVTFLEKLQ